MDPGDDYHTFGKMTVTEKAGIPYKIQPMVKCKTKMGEIRTINCWLFGFENWKTNIADQISY